MKAQFEQIEMIVNGKKFWVSGDISVYPLNGYSKYHDEIGCDEINISEVFDENGDLFEGEIKEEVAHDFIMDKFSLDNNFYETVYDQFVEDRERD